MQIINPGGNGERTERIWAYLVQHGPDDESLAAVNIDGAWFPLIATTDSALRNITGLAQTVADESGLPILLACFDHRTNVGSVRP